MAAVSFLINSLLMYRSDEMILAIWFVVGFFILTMIDSDSFLLSHPIMICITVSVLMGPIAVICLLCFLVCMAIAGALNFIFTW